MSVSNENNRPQILLPLPNFNNDAVEAVFYAHKDVYIREAGVLFSSALQLTPQRHWALTLRRLVRGGENIPVSDTLMLDAPVGRGDVFLFSGLREKLLCVKGDVLLLNANEVGNAPRFNDCSVTIDFEIKGN